MPFPYFGRKWRLGTLYPEPAHNTIVEPFAGSAAYSLRHWNRQVILYDIDSTIIKLWDYMIDPATTAQTILGLPDMVKGADIQHSFGNGPERTLAQLCSVSENYNKLTITSKMEERWPGIRQRIAADIHKVKHWQACQGSYTEAPSDLIATWFIDPPYQKVQYGYADTRATIDYTALGHWARNLPGQVITCELEGATWLPFTHLTDAQTQNNTKRKEVVWIKEQ